MKTLLQGGTVVSGDGLRRMDVLLENGKVAGFGPQLSGPQVRVVDCTGKLLFPGFIDGHTHFDLEVGGTITADDFRPGARRGCRYGSRRR